MNVTTPRWPLERVLFALAGSVTLISALLAATVTKWFLLLTAFVGVNQWLYVAFGACPASIVLRRTCKLRSLSDAPEPAPVPDARAAARLQPPHVHPTTHEKEVTV
ncbi:MAG TPA: hypothetical protein VFN55_04235 [Solirubrobacteraceae bacterium]|nr:hypothetical protein [Solirubrobacteraceae bacterium]